MMNARLDAVRSMGKVKRKLPEKDQIRHSVQFALHSFHLKKMEEVLPKKICTHYQAAVQKKEKLDPSYLSPIAEAMKVWAVHHGATHFAYWFQPLNGTWAEKHDAFLSFSEQGAPVEAFEAESLLKGEMKGSNGYLSWDISSAPFLKEAADGVTLYIPSLYCSYQEDALDYKLPFLRSEEKLESTLCRLLNLLEIGFDRVYSTLEIEQQFFVLDKNLYSLRPDLVLAERTVCGAKASKGEELCDHSFGPLSERVLSFFQEVEEKAALLGIPLKTRQKNTSFCQFEIASHREESTSSIDHNLLLMELMKQVGIKHEILPLFHEKPFGYVRGSKKCCGWSLFLDKNRCLLDPNQEPFAFFILLTAILRAVWEHRELLKASVGSSGNDLCLAEDQAATLSIFLGRGLEKLLDELMHPEKFEETLISLLNCGLSPLNLQEKDPFDPNQTSFLAFKGDKIEWKAVGASQNPAFSMTIFHGIVSDSLSLILDEMEDVLKDEKHLPKETLFQRVLPVLRKHLKLSESMVFPGKKREETFPRVEKSFHAFFSLLDKKTTRAMSEIFSEKELKYRFDVLIENYAKEMNIEMNLMVELFRTQIFPAAVEAQKNRASSLFKLQEIGVQKPKEQEKQLEKLTSLIEKSLLAIHAIEEFQEQIQDFGWEAKGKAFAELGSFKMREARFFVDQLENEVDNRLWPLPKYRELFFLL